MKFAPILFVSVLTAFLLAHLWPKQDSNVSCLPLRHCSDYISNPSLERDLLSILSPSGFSSIYVFYAPSGSGKTVLLRHLVETINQTGFYLNSPQDLSPNKTLIEWLEESLPGLPIEWIEPEPRYFLILDHFDRMRWHPYLMSSLESLLQESYTHGYRPIILVVNNREFGNHLLRLNGGTKIQRLESWSAYRWNETMLYQLAKQLTFKGCYSYQALAHLCLAEGTPGCVLNLSKSCLYYDESCKGLLDGVKFKS